MIILTADAYEVSFFFGKMYLQIMSYLFHMSHYKIRKSNRKQTELFADVANYKHAVTNDAVAAPCATIPATLII